jgi:multidrug resistance protein, MATE family
VNRRILKLAIPNIISNLTVPLVGMVDVALMGRENNPAYLGAIALGATIFTFIYSGLGFLRMGTSGFTAQSRGARNLAQAYVILARALIIALVLGLFLIALQKPIAFLAFHFLDSSQTLETFAKEYFFIRIWAAPASLLLFAIMGWYIGMQNAKIPMWISIAVNLINIVFSLLFVVKYNMSAKGVAFGTLIGQYCGLIIGIILLLLQKNRLKKYWIWSAIFIRKEIFSFLNVNKDILIRSILLTGSFYYFNAASASLGDNILAINSILLQFLWVFSYFIDGFAFAAEALTGKYIGAKNPKNLKLAVKYLFIWGGALSFAVTIIYFSFNSILIKAFTNQEKIFLMTQDYSFWIIFLPIVSFSAFIWDGIYIGATESKTMRNAMLFSSLCIFIPLLLILKHFYGNHGMWIALLVFMLFRGISLHLFYQKKIITKSLKS